MALVPMAKKPRLPSADGSGLFVCKNQHPSAVHLHTGESKETGDCMTRFAVNWNDREPAR
ncbi:hypothetical protein BJF95_04530 [Rhizobium oryziradicis]|uniref:Uncharacterized protein n=1 Tax=Rhizobium oryziradicis TaxID=1867956 RepID=A0A1Q8ZWY2_9HYPH|nr:hypothetical protein BJF95_04530 [Rhizobium oryziradicis]